jgi:glutathione S-transferase
LLLGRLLDIEFEWQDVNILAGDTKTDLFLAKNANGKIPILELDDGRILTESNAIIDYLASGTPWFPDDPWQRSECLKWQFFEQYSHEPYIAVARFIAKYLGLPDDRRQEYKAKQHGGHKALAVMEQTLSVQPYLVGEQPTVADISLYAYTHVAHEGGFELDAYPAIQAWLKRIEALPRYLSMPL